MMTTLASLQRALERALRTRPRVPLSVTSIVCAARVASILAESPKAHLNERPRDYERRVAHQQRVRDLITLAVHRRDHADLA